MSRKSENNIEQYVKKRKKFRLWGFIGVIFAILNLLDAGTPFPIPFTGHIAVYLSILILIPSAIVLSYSLLKPSARIIEDVAKITNGYILSSVLIHYLHISTDTADDIVMNLFQKGYLDIMNKITNDTPIPQWVCIFIGIAGESQQTEQQRNMARDDNLNMEEYTSTNKNLNVRDINQMLLGGSFNVGESGQIQ